MMSVLEMSLKQLSKIAGKWVTYIGLVSAFAGIHYSNVVYLLFGIFMITGGCISHEIAEVV